MILETLFIKSLESILGGLAQAGFGHLIKVVQDKLKGTDEERRKKAFKKAFEQAKGVVTNEELKPLLDQESFQAEVAVALLDPLNSFNVQTSIPGLENYPPEAAYSLKRFLTPYRMHYLMMKHGNRFWNVTRNCNSKKK